MDVTIERRMILFFIIFLFIVVVVVVVVVVVSVLVAYLYSIIERSYEHTEEKNSDYGFL
jgi:heme/copper-type cytochrome/quinol oxidase subunit 2